MDTNKNLYTVIYATVLVVLVAAILAFVASSLKSKQQKNIDVEKQMSLLKAVGLAENADNQADKTTYIETEFAKFITSSLVVNYKGEISEEIKSEATNKEDIVKSPAFKIDLKAQYDLMKQIATATEEQKEALKAKLQLPVFECTLASGEKLYIFSCYGAGLWGPIWGYIAVKEDFNTVYGASFGHKGETPGLGAEIATDNFGHQFANKQLFDNTTFTSINIMKGGATPGNLHEVDAISGGTITSKSLDATIKNWMEFYLPYIENYKKAAADAKAMQEQALNAPSDSLGMNNQADSLTIK
jgi:Na+-transporting NADH:ubiquinone oxidoreductase subunit C